MKRWIEDVYYQICGEEYHAKNLYVISNRVYAKRNLLNGPPYLSLEDYIKDKANGSVD